jgi:hypothetical protein
MADDDEEGDIGTVCSALCRVYSDDTTRLLADSAWCAAFAAAASSSPGARVLVIGFGSAVPALAAARAGCDVVWAQRVALTARHLDSVSGELARANGVADSVRVTCVREWNDLRRLGARGMRFDLVITESVADDPVADGLLTIARLAHSCLLAPGGRMAPSRLTIRALLLGVRVPRRAGFDVSLMNELRSEASTAWRDGEHLAFEEGHEAVTPLSPPLTLLDLDLEDPDTWPAAVEGDGLVHEASVAAERAGVLTAVLHWVRPPPAPAELHSGSSLRLLGTDHCPAASAAHAHLPPRPCSHPPTHARTAQTLGCRV